MNCPHTVVSVSKMTYDAPASVSGGEVSWFRSEWLEGICTACGERVPVPEEAERMLNDNKAVIISKVYFRKD